MEANFLFFLENYFSHLYVAHVIISIVLAVFLSFYTMKRFERDTKEVELKDAKRLEVIANENFIFKLLFKASLHKNNRLTNILFMFLFNYTMPLIGYIFSLWVTWYLTHVRYDRVVAHTNLLNLDEFGATFLKVERIFGEGSMKELMHSEYAPKSKKIKALSALSNNASPANLRVIRETLSSSEDEIRMFGYAIINKAEKSLNTKINYQVERFNEATTFLSLVEDDDASGQNIEKMKEQKAEAAKELAHYYWEMIYTELSHESLKEEFMKDVLKYIGIAKEYYSKEISETYKEIEELNILIQETKEEEIVDEYLETLEKKKFRYRQHSDISTKLYVLMGRVYMGKKDYDRAITEFTIAQELNTTDSSFILPYIAEIHFMKGNYKVVSSILNKSKDLELNYTLYPIVEQWKVA